MENWSKLLSKVHGRVVVFASSTIQLRHRWCGLALSMSGLARAGAGAMPVPCQLSSPGILRQEHCCQCWCSFFTWESYLNHLNLPSRESASKQHGLDCETSLGERVWKNNSPWTSSDCNVSHNWNHRPTLTREKAQSWGWIGDQDDLVSKWSGSGTNKKSHKGRWNSAIIG